MEARRWQKNVMVKDRNWGPMTKHQKQLKCSKVLTFRSWLNCASNPYRHDPLMFFYYLRSLKLFRGTRNQDIPRSGSWTSPFHRLTIWTKTSFSPARPGHLCAWNWGTSSRSPCSDECKRCRVLTVFLWPFRWRRYGVMRFKRMRRCTVVQFKIKLTTNI